jgi:hypothetical protein
LLSIRGRGKRFDYRAPLGSRGKGIFEAKGTKYKKNQAGQILKGLDKKKAHHRRGENFDVELIVSTCVGVGKSRPRILVADPEFQEDVLLFGPLADKYYRLRHYAKVLQFLAMPKLARQYYVESNQMIDDTYIVQNDGIDKTIPEPMNVKKKISNVWINGVEYSGSWESNIIPEKSKRYEHLKEKLPQKSIEVEVFRGIKKETLNLLQAGRVNEIELGSWEITKGSNFTDQGYAVSVFPDGTILSVRPSGL